MDSAICIGSGAGSFKLRIVDLAHEARARPVRRATVRMHEEVLHRSRADMELREIDAAVQERRELARGKAELA